MQTHGMRGSRAAPPTPSPVAGGRASTDACDASLAPLNGAVGTCTDTLVSGTSCVPDVRRRVRAGGRDIVHRPGADEGYVLPMFTTRAELKAAVDACVGDRLCELTMPYWDVSQVTDMSFLFQGKTQFNVNIGQWEMSQVTDVRGYVPRRLQLLPEYQGMDPGNNANTTGMFTGADTWLFRAYRPDGTDTTDGPPDAWSFKACLEDERVELGACKRCTGRGFRAAGDDPASGDTPCSFPDRNELKAAVDNCLAVDPTGVACCNPRRGLRRCGDGRDGRLGRVAGDEHERLVQWQGAVQCGYIAVGRQLGHDHVPDVPRCRGVQPRYRYMGHLERHDHGRACSTTPRAFNQDIGTWDTSSVTNMESMFYQAYAFNQHLSRWDVSSVTTMQEMFDNADAFNKMPEGWDTSKVTDSSEYI